MVELWIAAVILAALIALSGFFSGLEVALVGVRKSKVIQLLNEGKKGSKALHKLKTNPSWMMSSVNLGNNLVNVGASALATSVAIQLFGDDVFVIGIVSVSSAGESVHLHFFAIFLPFLLPFQGTLTDV